MEIRLYSILENAMYLLALLNPPSKIMFLAGYQPTLTRRQNFELSWKSSLAATIMLILLAGTGQFLLSHIFHVELYSLQITGGMVVFVLGWTAITKGCFVQKTQGTQQNDFTDISLVPLAAPLIAGPGLIAAAIAGSVANGLLPTCLALICAITVNFILMVFSGAINKLLTKTHLLGPLIRVTGLIIAAVAMQMVITGLKTCINSWS